MIRHQLIEDDVVSNLHSMRGGVEVQNVLECALIPEEDTDASIANGLGRATGARKWKSCQAGQGRQRHRPEEKKPTNH